MSARILCRTGPLSGATHEIDSEATIGRGAGNDVVLHSRLISDRHARIWLEEGDWYVEDLGSLNGTRLDGERLTAPAHLDGLHVLDFAGAADFVFVPESADAPSPPDAGTELDFRPPGSFPDLREEDPSAGADVTRVEYDMPPLPDLEGEAPPATPSRTTRFALRIVYGGETERTWDLVPGEQVLGRDPDCAIPIEDEWLSRAHAVVIVEEDRVTVRDRGSLNGIFVADERIESVDLRPGDSFRLGPLTHCTLERR